MYLILSSVLTWIVLQASIRADCQYQPDPYNIKQIFVLRNGAYFNEELCQSYGCSIFSECMTTGTMI